MPILSKSRFLSGSQCEKKLFFDVFRKELRPPVKPAQQALFDTGHKLGIFAQTLFPDGRDTTEGMNGKWNIAIERTKQWIAEGHHTIYEAAFSIPGGFSALDILHQQKGERWAIEVKSSTEVKEYHITDASYQYYVMHNAGFKPDKFFLMHINNRYVKSGEVLPAGLFHLEDITQEVLANQPLVQQKQAALIEMLDKGVEPQRGIGKHCSNPFDCDYSHHCRLHLPENNVFELFNARGKEWKLYEQGILLLQEVPDDFPLEHRQVLQVRGIKYNEQYLDRSSIDAFLRPVAGPLYFFDFETIRPAIPVLNGTRPFEQIPFQYSLHVTDINGEIQAHLEFLAEPEDFTNSRQQDPRLQLIRQLKKDIGPQGSIIAYNAPFEISILKSLAAAFEEERSFIESIIERFVDLLIPFKNGWFYKPEMGGTASIKSVLPAIAPEFSYDDLEIGNGGLASDIFLSMIENNFSGNKDDVVKNLLQYCERDTEGMVLIYRHLKEIIAS